MIARRTNVILATKGVYTGKPRPSLVIQSDDFSGTDSITVC